MFQRAVGMRGLCFGLVCLAQFKAGLIRPVIEQRQLSSGCFSEDGFVTSISIWTGGGVGVANKNI